MPIDARVADLLARMTRTEKVAQLGSFWGFDVVRVDGLDPDRLAALAGHGIGHLTRLAGSTNLRPAEVAETANAIQRYLVEGTRLGIPAIIHEECLHGLIAWARRASSNRSARPRASIRRSSRRSPPRSVGGWS